MKTGLSRLCAGIALALAAGCGSGEPAAVPDGPAPAATGAVAGVERAAPRPPACRAGAVRRLGSDRLAYAAVVREAASARKAPGGAVLRRFGATNQNGAPTVFGILAEAVDERCRATWYRVRLPMKPNGATGWVAARDVDVGTVRTRILVDLSDRTVTLFRDGRVLLEATAAIGSAATPTPTGEYYVDQRLIPTDPTGPFGPGAIGISAFSEVLTGWAQGGPVAIHGTNRPGSVGQAVSNGCLRLRNDVLRRMFDATLAGTPVTIRA